MSEKEVIVTRENPLEINGPQKVRYDSITIKEGGQIKVTGDVTIQTDKLIKEDGSEKKVAFRQVYFKNNIQDRQIHRAPINTKDYPNGFVISENEEENSLLKRNEVQVPDIQTLKKIIRNGNESSSDYQNLVIDKEDNLTPWDYNLTTMEYSALNYLDQRRLCGAFKQYVYGDSTKVADYEKALNQYYFPMVLSAYEAEDIIVTKDHPLSIKGGEDIPVIVSCNNLIIENAGEVVISGCAHIIANNCISETDAENNLGAIIWTQSTSGTDGQPGGKGAAGANGYNGTGNGESGQDGTKGTDGGAAGNGSDGGAGNLVNMDTGKMKGTYWVMAYGGNGGNGGKGGQGGQGGNGGNASTKHDKCDPGKPGKGGQGGQGGQGGKGGDGGNGGVININYVDYPNEEKPNFILPTQSQVEELNKQIKGANYPSGQGGKGGEAGEAGEDGKDGKDANGMTCVADDGHGGGEGDPGDPGTPGAPGTPGKAGNIYITARPSNI